MASVATGFWAGWVVVLTTVSALGLLWLVVSVYFGREPMADISEQVWDETLREGATPAPLWWFWFILALLATSVVYLMLYPGLGTHRGVLEWSQGGQIAASRERFDARFGAERQRIAAASAAALAQEPTALQSGWHLFNQHCSACHGTDARGQAALFPDLRNDAWQWGGSEQQIAATIVQGRTATMPAWQAVLGEAGVANVAAYVRSLAGGNAPADSPGATTFRNTCSACHGMNGEGLPTLGAPALNDDEWLYGGSERAVRLSIAAGRNGRMPAFGERLDATQVQLLTAWLMAGAPVPDDALNRDRVSSADP